VYINTATEGLQWGFLVYQQWSFASSGGDSARDEVSKLWFQPIITKHFRDGWYLSSGDVLWSIDWNDNARWRIPSESGWGASRSSASNRSTSSSSRSTTFPGTTRAASGV
jgi:hypothetical protein